MSLLEENFHNACSTGNLDWLKSQPIARIRPFIIDKNFCAQAAAKSGHLDVLKWLHAKAQPKLNLDTFDYYAITTAAENNHVEVVKWLLSNEHPKAVRLQRASLAFEAAAEYGNLDLIKWLAACTDLHINLGAQSKLALRAAIHYGHLETVKWFLEESGKIFDVRTLKSKLKFAGSSNTSVWVFTTINDACKDYVLAVREMQLSIAKSSWGTEMEHFDLMHWTIIRSLRMDALRADPKSMFRYRHPYDRG